jgi:chromosome segregation ATPase
MKSLFDNDIFLDDKSKEKSSHLKKEVVPLDRLKNLEEKISNAVEKVKALKEDKIMLERKIKDLENMLNEKNMEVEALKSEKVSIKNQVEELLSELETLEI